jgi:hypothetical protein
MNLQGSSDTEDGVISLPTKVVPSYTNLMPKKASSVMSIFFVYGVKLIYGFII